MQINPQDPGLTVDLATIHTGVGLFGLLRLFELFELLVTRNWNFKSDHSVFESISQCALQCGKFAFKLARVLARFRVKKETTSQTQNGSFKDSLAECLHRLNEFVAMSFQPYLHRSVSLSLHSSTGQRSSSVTDRRVTDRVSITDGKRRADI